MHIKFSPTIMVIDACSDKNAGDAAMQLALRDLIADIAPASKILVAARFGCNQSAAALKELESFNGVPNARVISGTFPTFVHFSAEENQASQIKRKIGKALAAARVTPLLFALALGLSPIASLLARFQGSKLYQEAEKSGFIIWNGRNFRRIDGLRGYFKLVELLANPAFLAPLAIPKAMYGVSFWPVKSAFAKWILRGVMSRYDHIYVRETESLKRGQEIGLTNIKLMPDLSFYHLAKLHQRTPRGQIALADREPQVALTLVAQRELTGVLATETYVKLITDTITHIRKTYDLSVVIVRQVTYGPEVEDKMIDRIQQACGPIEVLPAPRNIDDLLEVYAQSRMLLATRMHSAIFALSCSTPVVTLPYDWKGKWQILADLGLPETCMIPLNIANGPDLIKGVDAAMISSTDWSAIAQNVRTNSNRLYNIVSKDLASLSIKK